MAIKMLIDARHPEETRVAVVDGSRIAEFDFEADVHKQIRGNIYLAKITRVEPSLQAAFVDYGGNRHGFLAFSEIHPDYYQIPKEDREALLREEQEIAEAQVEANDEAAEAAAEDVDGSDDSNGSGDSAPTETGGHGPSETHGESDDTGAEALRQRRMSLRKRYKIQEVIRRRQVMLVQVVKEERGNKGAALTTYISLAGRYSVLMPNTAKGGGISRRISNAADRKRLKKIIAELQLPSSMGAIVRTAGLKRTKTEIKRDFDYLARLWDEIREKTLGSSAPALIYEDSDLIKRAIRDIYNRDIEEVLVDGADGYTQAKDFMKLLMPSHARRVKAYTEAVPLFHQAGVENQLAMLLDPVVTLKSGGYLVINPTEALVSIDVNSGRSTREYNIEETALKTNIEAAEEVARQLRLRDLAGLVVVDFIDMESHGNDRKVERALKEALKQDRARIQVGRISAFGLLEMSRQRLRTGILEASTHVCPMCEGLGLVRTEGSAALAALRLLEEEALKAPGHYLCLKADMPVAVYLWNHKRVEIADIETRYGVTVLVEPDASLSGGRCKVAVQAKKKTDAPAPAPEAGSSEEAVDSEADRKNARAASESAPTETRHEGERSSRRRRGRRGGRGRDGHGDNGNGSGNGRNRAAAESSSADAGAQPAESGDEASARPDKDQDDGKTANIRKSRRRGGRRKRSDAPATTDSAESSAEADASADDAGRDEPAATEARPAETSDGQPSRPASDRSRQRRQPAEAAEAAEAPEVRAASAPAQSQPAQEQPASPQPEMADGGPSDSSGGEAGETGEAPRRGWWQRTFGG